MTSEPAGSAPSRLRQGDLLALDRILLSDSAGGEFIDTPHGVAIVSQTCDVLQANKSRVTVAALRAVDANTFSLAKKGRIPLLIAMPSSPSGVVIDGELLASLPKSQIEGASLSGRLVSAESGIEARTLAVRLARIFGRFPFPDEVHPILSRLRKKAFDVAGKKGHFAQIVDHVEEIRVRASHWDTPGRDLRVYFIVDSDYIIPAEDSDPDWQESAVLGLARDEVVASLSLARTSELIIANASSNSTSMLRLWHRWAQAIEEELLIPALDEEVVSVAVEVVAEAEFTYSEWKLTESLDLEVLSHLGV